MSTIFVLFSAFNKHINNLREKQDIFKNMVKYLQYLKIVRITCRYSMFCLKTVSMGVK